ncbi:conserved hypothetical protein [uncultured delta proteobacterium]|uniref:Selenium-dependent hydroxylase accessory protein YqeC n=1 Tax=uncultured delta proteobacterium TaxID=34034 RepID=A0A212JC95_9DELT|nr:conserved hypothetical protein [uncultured delta proteobacterium]
MHGFPVSLEAEQGVASPGLLCLTGGGGKTTLLFALGRAFAAAGQRVLGTTTTRMYRPSSIPGLTVTFPDNPEGISVPANGFVFAAKNPPPDGDPAKVHGYAPEVIDELHRRGAASRIIVEADGAAGRPLKAPADHEPVIPATTGAVIAVIGLSCFCKPFSAAAVFRPERVSAITGLSPEDAITPGAVVALITHREGLFKNTPPQALRLLFCNQADLPGTHEPMRALAGILAGEHPGFLHGLYAGSLQQEGLLCRRLIPA